MIVTDKGLDFLEAIKSAKGTNAKKEILKSNLGIGNEIAGSILYNTFNPYITFNVVKVPKVRNQDRKPLPPDEAWELFFSNTAQCAKREVTGNAAINLIHCAFMNSSEQQEKWMRKILKKNLAIGISVKSINKVAPNFIPTFDVALAQKFDMKRIQGDEVYVEPKLDGIRCLAIVENGKAKLFTRAGKLITNFDETVGKELRLMDDGCYDGEIMSNDFTDLMRQVYRKENKDIADVYLSLFDYIPLSEWRAGKSQTSCRERYEILEDQVSRGYRSAKRYSALFDYIRVVDRYTVPSDHDKIKAKHDEFVSNGYEGAMVKNIDAPYSFGRDWSVMKYKAFFDADVPIIGLKEGTGKHQGKLGSFLVDYKGVEVNVGSGLNDELREKLWGDTTIIGRIIEVRYQEETPDGSLRFPTFVCFRNDKE